MEKIYVVTVKDWFGDMIPYSYHRTEASAEKMLEKAKKEYNTVMGGVDEADLQD